MSMSVTDLKNILETVATVMETGVQNYPAELSQKVIGYLQTMPAQNIDLIAGLLKVDAATMQQDISKALKVATTIDALFTDGQAQEISKFARDLKDRPLILQFLAWKLN